VITGGFNLKIEASNMLRGRLCGLCGDFNGEKMGELKGPRGCVFTHPHRFGRSYMLPSESCNNKNEQVPEIESDDDDDNDDRSFSWEPETFYEEIISKEMARNPKMCMRDIYEPEEETENEIRSVVEESLFGHPKEMLTNIKTTVEVRKEIDEPSSEDYDSSAVEMRGARPCVRYITKVVTKEDKICFSVKPVPECNLSCKPTKHITKEIGYHCKPLGAESQRYMASARFGIVREMLGLSPHFSSHTSLPESCEMITV
jgi:hypothetical protein